jgi:GAF domain-containing protein
VGRADVVPSVDDAWLEASEELALIPEWRRLGARALLIAPLVAGGETLGALTLISVDGRSFGAEQQALAEKYAAVAAGALANAKLYGHRAARESSAGRRARCRVARSAQSDQRDRDVRARPRGDARRATRRRESSCC